MSTVVETTQQESEYTKLRLTTAQGPVYRPVKRAPPRAARPGEIPIIDISSIFSASFSDRQRVANEIRAAATTIGFFYATGHRVPETIIDGALQASKEFFAQPPEVKRRASVEWSKAFNGWQAEGAHRANATESVDRRESFAISYDPREDPAVRDVDVIPKEIREAFKMEQFVWEETKHLPEFKPAVLEYWRACLALARKLVRAFALALELPEEYFDAKTSHPDLGLALNYYPALLHSSTPSVTEAEEEQAVSIGSHTDLQFFTLLWQDARGGLQLLTRGGEWITAPPIDGTFVVNVGDYLQRISNDYFVSTVHRAQNRSGAERYSMPAFFGFNLNETCEVLSSCVDKDHPPKYEPISCRDWVLGRFKVTAVDFAEEA